MLGITLIIIGSLMLLSGVFIYTSAKKELATVNTDVQMEDLIQLAVADGILTKKEESKIRGLAESFDLDAEKYIDIAVQRIENSEEDSETELIDVNKKMGDDFEKFVVQKFRNKHFKLVHWAGDKYVEGMYDETTQQPDILVELTTTKDTVQIWVECKYRSSVTNEEVKLAYLEQFKRYKNYQETRNIPVFIAFGRGGKAQNPSDLYMIPLDALSSGVVSIDTVEIYKTDIDKMFFFDAKTMVFK